MSEERKGLRKSRLRFWVWLLIWAFALAAVEQSSQAGKHMYWDFEEGAARNGGRLAVIFLFLTAVNLIFSYLAVRAWKNRPSSRRARFWLGMLSVFVGILWFAILCGSDAVAVEELTGIHPLLQVFFRSVVFLFGLLVLFSFRHFFRWLCSWRILKRCLWAAACLALCVAAFYAVENWRGKRAWENYRREWEAKGEKFDFISFAPPPVPDEQNFALSPIVASAYAAELDGHGQRIKPASTTITNRLKMEFWRTNYGLPTNVTIGSWQTQKRTELGPWQAYYRATALTNIWLGWSPEWMPGIPAGLAISNTLEHGDGTNRIEITPLAMNEFPVADRPQSPAEDVLLALSRFDAAIEELRQAGRRPYSRFPLTYQMENPVQLLLPHLGSMKGSAQVLQLRAIAELQQGRAEQALADVKLIWRLAESCRSEPVLLSHLVRIAVVNLALQPVWEGLAEHRWSEAQLKEISRELHQVDFVSDFEFSLRGERAMNIEAIDYLRKHPDDTSDFLLLAACPKTLQTIDDFIRQFPDMPQDLRRFMDSECRMLPDNLIGRVLIHLPPRGWYEQNKLHIAKTYQEHLFQIGNPEKHLLSRQATKEAENCLAIRHPVTNMTPYNVFAGMLLPAIPRSADKFGAAQSAVDLAAVACAVELYRLAHGEYPETLAALTPQLIEKIPADVINGEPLHYRRMNDGRFILYSVGWNGKDDGGEVGLRKPGKIFPQTGDTVWQYPVKH